ncbi:MAG: elongation factor G-like protein EF-G2 [Propionibacteriales bacterium]|nr:elongation factor G-like protein EF-G2 [Propionibacteriales bacterium]
MSGKQAGDGAAQRQAQPPADPDSIRNVVLVGPTGSGKSTLVEALLLATGEISRMGRVEDGTTVCDYDDAEIRQQRTIGLSLAPVRVGGVKINLLDTPGYADFVGDLRAGLRAADCALFVVSACDGIDGVTRVLWQECEAVGMPRCVVITKLNHPRADYARVLAQSRAAFGDKVVPLYVPVPHQGSDIADLVALLSQTVSDYSAYADEGRGVRQPTGDERMLLDEHRGALIEGVIEESEDESLMDRYLNGEDIDLDLLVDDLETAVARGTFFPAVPVSALTGLGIAELLELMSKAFPAPSEHPLPAVYTTIGKPVEGVECNPKGPLLAEVVKTTSDAYVGRISLVRVFSGTVRPDAAVHVSGHFSQFHNDSHGHTDHDEDERVGALSSPLGKQQRGSAVCIAGDICAIAKLSRAETGDTLSDKDNALVMEPWSMPDPLLPIAVVAQAKTDEDKLGQALQRLAAEDPSVRIEHNPETLQLVLWCMGEAHADVLLDRLRHRYGVAVDQTSVRVPLRETFGVPSNGRGRHVKQSGGHGQYAVCEITVEPLPQGSGFEFVDKVVGGAVPRQFIPSVEKGVRAQLTRGLVAGYPVVDLRVTLRDGKAHSVDSSDMAFQTAGSLALRDAADDGDVSLLEPVDCVDVLIDDDFVGSVMGDLSTRRARVVGTEPVGTGRTLVRAEMPQLELVSYATVLRSLSHGTGTFSRAFARYEPVPDNVAAKLSRADK